MEKGDRMKKIVLSLGILGSFALQANEISSTAHVAAAAAVGATTGYLFARLVASSGELMIPVVGGAGLLAAIFLLKKNGNSQERQLTLSESAILSGVGALGATAVLLQDIWED